MIFATQLNYLYTSILFYIFCKIFCTLVHFRRIISMHNKRSTTLTSIPEKNECEEDNKWVPKKKHEVLKAKYKCLKKLFQIYDASVIGILPETYAGGDMVEDSDGHSRKSRKRKRSHRVKTDACAGTSEHSIPIQISCSKTDSSENESCTKVALRTNEYAATQASRESVCASEHECGCTQTSDVVYQPAPYRTRMSRERKRTRFQCFVRRLLGMRGPNPHRGCALAEGHLLAVSENDINHRSVERRRRRRLRFRRLRRPTRVQSDDGAMRGAPALLSCAQAVQRNCLLDTTPRQCPIAGCRMMLYGIINYNDHLNLCHFTERRFMCHFCHEGFERESDKLQHENVHVGLSHLAPSPPPPPPPAASRSRTGITSVTQTEPEPNEVQGEKLKKIVSFFDKIVDSTQIISDIKRSRHSEMNLRMSKTQTDTQTETSSSDGDSKHTSSCSDITGKRLTYSCNDLRRGTNYRSPGSDIMSQCCSPKCNFCGENFDYSMQMAPAERKFGGFHSCGALPARARTLRPRPCARAPLTRTEDGAINVTSVASSVLGLVECASSITQSSVTDCGIYNCDSSDPGRKPSTSIVFSASDCSRKVSSRSLADRFKSYKWEPCTRIIRV